MDGSYRILPDRGRYLLYSGNEVLGTLLVRKMRGEAEISVGGASLKLSRSAIFRKHLHIEHEVKGETEFTAGLTSGVLSMHGKQYNWFPENASWSAWCWQEPQSKRAIHIRMRQGLQGPQGRVEAANGLGVPDEAELALIGWYLILLSHEDFGTHLLSAAHRTLIRR